MSWGWSCVPTARATSLPEPKGAVLVTRPEPGAADTALRLTALGYVPVLAPVLTIRPRAPRLAGRFQAILATSANALQPGLPDLPLLAVGDATAARAREAGFGVVHSAGRDAEALAALALARCDPAGPPLLLLSGAGQGFALAGSLRAAGFRVQRRVAYAARPVASLPVLPGFGHALFFSPETARHFVRLILREPATAMVESATALAISEPTRTALGLLPWRRIHVASTPNQDALLALLP